MITPDEEARVLDAARAEGRKHIRAAIYCRISLASMGDTTKVDQQEEQCREICRMRGWDVGDVFTDNSRSAWQRNRKRPGWDAMLEGIGAGRFGAVASYWGDRIVRQPRDLEDWLDLREGRDLLFASVVGQYDLNNPDHRMMMRWEVARACNESDTISRRTKNHHEQRRREGLTRPGGRGGRAICFASDGVTHVPREVEWAREAARRILGGESTGSVAADLAARGWVTPLGRPMAVDTLKKVLLRPRMAGLMPDGESKGAWEPVVDRETWERVRMVLSAKAAMFPTATGARRWLLSGIAVCGNEGCGKPLQINMSQGRGRKEYVAGYACRDGCKKVYRSALHLDAYVGARVVARLANPLSPEGRAMPVDHAAEWAVLEREQADTNALLADYKASAGRTRTLMARLDQIDERMAELRDLAAGDSRTRLLDRYAGITREQWESELTLDVRRALVAGCFRVVVLPASGRGPGFRAEDVRLEPAG